MTAPELAQLTRIDVRTICAWAKRAGVYKPRIGDRHPEYSPEEIRLILAKRPTTGSSAAGWSICPYRCLEPRTDKVAIGGRNLKVCELCARYHETSDSAEAARIEQTLTERYGPPVLEEEERIGEKR